VSLSDQQSGSSPVQAGQISDEMRRLKANIRTLRCTPSSRTCVPSGGYYVAVAADKIFVNKASVVGSIILDGFGLVGTMERSAPAAC
jgi:protease-4